MLRTTSELGGRAVGREAELAVLDEFLASSVTPRALVLTGEPGIGKTTLWEAAVGMASPYGLRVLLARGSGAETQHSFAGLIDLLNRVGSEELAGLPSPQRQALEAALLRIEATDTTPETHATAFGFLNALRSLATRGPLLIAIDDVQWLDRTSADALAFAARRIDSEAIGFLLARRPGVPSDVERALERATLQRLDVGKLSLGATRRLLSERLGLSLPRHVLRQVFEFTLGNPLFALEVGRTLAARGMPAIGDDLPLPDAVDDLLGTRVAELPGPVRRLLLAVALDAELRVSQLEAIEGAAAMDDAVDAGVLLIDEDSVRPSHPLLATAAKSQARARERRTLHLELAGVVADEELRALHLALATQQPDGDLAATVAAAAAGAAARGAVQQAVVLAEHGLRLTPPGSAERSERLLALAEYLVWAGEPERVAGLLMPQLGSLPPGEARVRACLLLSDVEVVADAEADSVAERYLRQALAESADDPRLRAMVLPHTAIQDAIYRVERIGDAEERAREAVETGRRVGPQVERSGLYALSWARSLRGRAIDDLCERSRQVPGAAPYLAASPDRVAAQRLVWRGEILEARPTLTRLLSVADERGELLSYAVQRLHLCELELRAGEWKEAEPLLDEWSRDGALQIWPCYERCRALLAAGRGSREEAERWVAEALARVEETDVNWDRLETLRARGLAALLSGEPARAAESLGAVWEHTEREGVDEPGAFPVAPDLVEALAELGELDKAQTVVDRLQRLAEQQEHPWALVGAKRCSALVRLASERDDEGAGAELAAAADAYAALGLRFDRARTLLSLGRAQRRSRKWAAARESLERAVAELDEIGSPGWAAQTRAELARVGGRKPPATGELTTAERRVAELAAEGLANKEIAQSLFVSVRTVEVHLKHAYAKLGIRSRTQLARRLSEPSQ